MADANFVSESEADLTAEAVLNASSELKPPRSRAGSTSTKRDQPALDWNRLRDEKRFVSEALEQLSSPEETHVALDEDRALLQALGWPQSVIDELANAAAAANVSIVHAGIAAGTLHASSVYSAVSKTLSFATPGMAPCRIVLPGLPKEAWKLLDSALALPLASGAALNAQAVSLGTLTQVSKHLGAGRSQLLLMTRQHLIDSVTHTFGRALARRAVHHLLRVKPQWSAKSGLASWQALAGVSFAGLILGGAAVAPREAGSLLAVVCSMFFLLATGLRFLAVAHLLSPRRAVQPPPLIGDALLPRYTVFIPLYREAAVLPYLARAISGLDYPAAKLDVKIILESIDTETIETALRQPFPGNVDFIIVPDCQPRTKPKALNYALQFATGDLAVIFDAEDRPEPDQLRKAAARFQSAPADLACLQARLDYFNASENWLSRQFTIEYASLFRGILPLLSRFRLPLPLGGTSNHFRIDVLRKLCAWDPFNVTEDADLGMRLHRTGYRVETLDSTTFEEACCQTVPWVKQRTRWLKGWMQTFGVHMRNPGRTLRETGYAGFIAFNAYFAGIIVSALAHPIFYGVLAYDAVTGGLQNIATSTPAERILLAVAAMNFIGGYSASALLGWLSLRGTRHRGLRAHLVFIPVYWLFVSAAAYRAVWQLVRAPFYWEKTAHGVSKRL